MSIDPYYTEPQFNINIRETMVLIREEYIDLGSDHYSPIIVKHPSGKVLIISFTGEMVDHKKQYRALLYNSIGDIEVIYTNSFAKQLFDISVILCSWHDGQN